MPPPYIIDINIYRVFTTPVKGKVLQCPWGRISPGQILGDPGKLSTKSFQDFPKTFPLSGFIMGVLQPFAGTFPFRGDSFIKELQSDSV